MKLVFNCNKCTSTTQRQNVPHFAKQVAPQRLLPHANMSSANGILGFLWRHAHIRSAFATNHTHAPINFPRVCPPISMSAWTTPYLLSWSSWKCNSVYPGRNSSTFRRTLLSPSSRYMDRSVCYKITLFTYQMTITFKITALRVSNFSGMI